MSLGCVLTAQTPKQKQKDGGILTAASLATEQHQKQLSACCQSAGVRFAAEYRSLSTNAAQGGEAGVRRPM